MAGLVWARVVAASKPAKPQDPLASCAGKERAAATAC